MYYIYILRCSDNSLYTGITLNFQKRFEQHKAASPDAAKYTKSHKVQSVEALWCCESKGDALRLEARIKKLPKPKKEHLILNPSEVNFLGLECEYKYVLKEEKGNEN